MEICVAWKKTLAWYSQVQCSYCHGTLLITFKEPKIQRYHLWIKCLLILRNILIYVTYQALWQDGDVNTDQRYLCDLLGTLVLLTLPLVGQAVNVLNDRFHLSGSWWFPIYVESIKYRSVESSVKCISFSIEMATLWFHDEFAVVFIHLICGEKYFIQAKIIILFHEKPMQSDILFRAADIPYSQERSQEWNNSCLP